MAIKAQMKEVRVFYGTAKTVNHYDKNVTNSLPFFLLTRNQQMRADIIWGGGTKHDSYESEVGRVTGKISIEGNGDIVLMDCRCEYSNSPREEWNGMLKLEGDSYSAR